MVKVEKRKPLGAKHHHPPVKIRQSALPPVTK
jgi:hypothetical protein